MNENNVNHQQGFILVMVLFFLFIISLMALSLLNDSYLELRMSQNMSVTAQRLQAAETGLRLAEHRLNNLTVFISEMHEYFTYAGFQINAVLKRHKTHYCINQHLAYVYDIIVQTKQTAKQTVGKGFMLKTTYAITTKSACLGELILLKAGRSSWRELTNSS